MRKSKLPSLIVCPGRKCPPDESDQPRLSSLKTELGVYSNPPPVSSCTSSPSVSLCPQRRSLHFEAEQRCSLLSPVTCCLVWFSPCLALQQTATGPQDDLLDTAAFSFLKDLPLNHAFFIPLSESCIGVPTGLDAE